MVVLATGSEDLQTAGETPCIRNRSAHCSRQPFTYTQIQASIQTCCNQVRQYDCAEDDSLNRGFAGADAAAGLRDRRRQRLESQRRERRRQLSVLSSGPSNTGAIRSRAVGFVAETDRFLTTARRHSSGHGSSLFADRSPRATLRVNKKVFFLFKQWCADP